MDLLVSADGSPTDLARQISQQYLEIMVDEYQDTNDVQNCIFDAISRKGENLFTVGDVKQSIYRFRLAQPEIFLEKYLRYCMPIPPPLARPAKILLQAQFSLPAGGAGGNQFHFPQYPLPPDGGDGVRPGGAAVSWGQTPISRAGRETELHLVSVENTEDEAFDRGRWRPTLWRVLSAGC